MKSDFCQMSAEQNSPLIEISDMRPLADPLDLAEGDLRELLRYWLELRGERRFPVRTEIDPIALRFMLGRITLVDVLRAPLNFRWRLAGSWWTSHLGREATGQMIDDWPYDDQRELARRSYTQAVEAAGPTFGERRGSLNGRSISYDVLILPFGQGDEIDALMVGMVPKPGTRAAY